MGYIIKKGTGGGGGGDATAANQTTQIGEAQNTNLNLSSIIDRIAPSAGVEQSVFKDLNQQSVFSDSDANRTSLFYKSIRNFQVGAGVNNTIICQAFTNTTAALVAADLNTFLNGNNCFIVSLTSSQTALSHDLFLLYSV